MKNAKLKRKISKIKSDAVKVVRAKEKMITKPARTKFKNTYKYSKMLVKDSYNSGSLENAY